MWSCKYWLNKVGKEKAKVLERILKTNLELNVKKYDLNKSAKTCEFFALIEVKIQAGSSWISVEFFQPRISNKFLYLYLLSN